VRRRINLHALDELLQVRHCCELKRGRQVLTPSAVLTFLRYLGTLAEVLIYLFSDERKNNRALTMDVTGRNLPPVAASTVWLFVEAINTHKLPPRWDTAYFRSAVRQVEMTGFYLFETGWVPPPPTQTC
jgi:hypothetical protein